MSEKLRVVVIGTGNVASIAIRSLKGRSNMELVGVWGHPEFDAAKIGTDSGLLDSDEPNGVLITSDKEEIFALKPDCAVMVINIRDPREAAAINGEWYMNFLSRGINVVTTSLGDLMWPEKAAAKELCDQLDAVGKSTGASIFMNGQEPGFADHMAMQLASCSNTIKTLTISEMYNYSTTPARAELAPSYGFDEDPEFTAVLEIPDVQKMIWGITIHHIANELGYELEDITTSFEKQATDHDVECAWGTIPAGKVVAVRVRTCGIINGREAIVIEHVNRMAQDVAMDWPWTDRVGQIRVVIEGDPNLQIDMNVGVPEHPEELSYDGYVLTAMRVVNAIPEICKAHGGIVTIREIRDYLPSDAFRSDAVFIDHKVSKAK
ncbi:MAG: hypothetical protein IJ225_06965 [Solobacterium sp.]|nr:hypothetical protein [Solobacterium sp.]